MSKDLIPQPEKSLARKPFSWGKGALTWFYKETFSNWLYDQLGVLGRSAIMTTIFALVVRYASAIPLDLLLIAALFIAALIFFSLQRLMSKRRNAQLVSETETPLIENEKSPEELNDQIRRLQENNTTLEYALDLRRQELEKYDWVHNIVDAQASDISGYVTLELVRMLDPHSATPSLRFDFYIRNQSNYHITIDDKVEGAILFEGKPLTYPLTVIGTDLKEFPPLGVGVLAIEQPLRIEEVNHIAQFGDNARYYFLLNQLRVSIKGGENFPQVNPQRLKISDLPPTLPETNDKELKDRIRQLEAEKAAIAKPDITGKIKGVYCETWGNAKLGDDGRVCFDHHFAVNTFVANRGAATTIEEFKLVLKAGERSYEGVREKEVHDVKEGEINWRKWGADELGDLEKSNDTPLENSRNGWLWFVVFRVENVENKAEMELELYAVDKDGISYKLDTSPQPQWQRNPFMYKEMVAAQRAQMREHF